MSQAALLQACRDTLQEVLALDSDSCQVTLPPGMPFPGCGQVFVAVHWGSWRVGDFWGGDVGIDERHGCRVTVTRRLSDVPQDRWGVEVGLKLLDPMMRKIVMALSGDTSGNLNAQTRYIVLQQANVYIGLRDPDTGAPAGYAGGFVEPLKFVDGGIPEIKGPEWFTSPPLTGEMGETIECGVAQTATFFGARRAQRIDQAT